MAPARFEELLQRARAGDTRARDQLFARSMPSLHHWANQQRGRDIGRPGLDRPSDIVQETALRAHDKFHTFRGHTEAEWRVWLKRIFAHRRDQGFRDARRQKRDVRATRSLDSAHVAETVAASQHTASQSVAHEQDWQQTLGRIYQLPQPQRDAIYMYHLKEHTVAEVATIMGKTEAAVAGLLRRGLHTLRQAARAHAATEPEIATRTDDAGERATGALLAFLRRRDTGELIDRVAFLAEHPDCADDLADMLAWIDHIEEILPGPPAP